MELELTGENPQVTVGNRIQCSSELLPRMGFNGWNLRASEVSAAMGRGDSDDLEDCFWSRDSRRRKRLWSPWEHEKEHGGILDATSLGSKPHHNKLSFKCSGGHPLFTAILQCEQKQNNGSQVGKAQAE